MSKIIKSKEKGCLIVISGPSGSGKDTICERLREYNGNFWVSISCTSRKPRKGEEEGVNYYFKTKDGVVYEIINDDFDHPIKLFQFNDLVEWNVKYGVISGISKNTLYTYTNRNGLRPVIVNNELIYNYKNICDFMKK